MKKNFSRIGNQRGAVLISALAFAIVISFIVAGIAVVTVSHYQRATTEGDYAAALQMAEAGINWEIRKMSQTGISSDTAASPSTPAALTYTGMSGSIPGTFSAWVTNDPDTGVQWTAPNPAVVWGKGTVNGVVASLSRVVHISAKRKSIFDEYALFGIVTSGFNGNYIIDGQYGSNGPAVATGNSSVIYGNFIFNGYNAGTYSGNLGWVGGSTTPGPAYGPYGTVTHQPDAIVWPTTSQIADVMATKKAVSLSLTPPGVGGGLNWFKAHNDNAFISVFAAGDAALTDPNAAPITTPVPASALQDAQGNWILPVHSAGAPDPNVMDNPSNPTKRYVFPATTWSFINPTNSVTIAAVGAYGTSNNVIFLPGSGNPAIYRDYYFENITMTGGDVVIVDIARGPIRIWLDAPDGNYATKDDSLGTFIFTTNTTVPIVTATSNPSQFRIYDNKGISSGGGSKGVLALSGSVYFPGGMYDYNGTQFSTVSFGGGSVIYGSVIAGGFSGNGNPLIKFPNNALNGTLDDWSLWWGFKNSWVEENNANK